MRNDKETFKTMAWGFVIICICCGFMHRILVKKGNLYIERSKPRYTLDKKDVAGDMKEGVGVVDGVVSAVSYDKFFLKVENGKTHTFLKGDLEMPQVGKRLSVTYVGGQPPKALMYKNESKTSSKL